MTALRLLYRARYLMLLVCGEDHPEMTLLDVSYNHSNVIIVNNRDIENKPTICQAVAFSMTFCTQSSTILNNIFYNFCIFPILIKRCILIYTFDSVILCCVHLLKDIF